MSHIVVWIMSGSDVIGNSRIVRSSQLCAELLLLIADVGTGPMILGHVVDPVRIVLIEGFTCRIKHQKSSFEKVRTAVECILV